MANWEGSNSSKFGKTKKLVKFVPLTDSTTQGLYGDIDSGIERIKGKRHFSLMSEQRHYTWRSSIKIPEPVHFTPRPAGVRRISPVYLEPRVQIQRKHVTPVRQATVGATFNDSCEVKYSGSYVMNNRIW